MRKISYEQGNEIKEKNNFDLFMETSAKEFKSSIAYTIMAKDEFEKKDLIKDR